MLQTHISVEALYVLRKGVDSELELGASHSRMHIAGLEASLMAVPTPSAKG